MSASITTKKTPSNIKTSYSEIGNTGFDFWAIFSCFALLMVLGLGAFNYMHHHGHYVTDMNNQVVWGMPHVFAIFLILAASGAANIATLGTVFKKQIYQPQGRLSLLLAASLLIGGLVVILLDLGRIDHVIEMAKGALNFSSVFAWNVILYSGFLAIIVVYLWTMMDRVKLAKSLYKPLGFINLIWRIVLTTGTGSIFGVLLARQSYEVLTMVPLFLAASYALGTAAYSISLIATYKLSKRDLGYSVIERLKNSLPIFLIAVLLFELIRYLASAFMINHPGSVALPLLAEGFSTLFWLGQVLVGSLLPIALLWGPWFKNNSMVVIVSSLLILLGGIIQLYIIIIGGQSHPLVLFPDVTTSSTFADGIFNSYSATLPEYLLGLGGIGLTFCIFMIGIKIFRMMPTSLAD